MKDNRMPGASNDLVLKVTRASQMMVLSRKTDYEQYRMLEMEAAFKNVKFATWVPTVG